MGHHLATHDPSHFGDPFDPSTHSLLWLKHIVGGWRNPGPGKILRAIRAVATVWEAGEILFFVH